MHRRSRSGRRPRGDGTRGPCTSYTSGYSRLACITTALELGCCLALCLLLALAAAALAGSSLVLALACALLRWWGSAATASRRVADVRRDAAADKHGRRVLYGGEADEVIRFVGRTRRTDHARILQLAAAGWSAPDIAADQGVTRSCEVPPSRLAAASCTASS